MRPMKNVSETKRRALLLYALCVALPLLATAQAPDSAAYNESVVVTGEYQPVLDRTPPKLNVAPQFTDTALGLQHTFSYEITPRRLTSIFQPTRIKAAKIIGEPTTRLYPTYFRLGLGNYRTGLLDAFYNSTRHERLKYGVGLQHLSSWGDIGKKPKDDVPDNPLYYGAAHYANTQLMGFASYIVNGNAELATSLRLASDYDVNYGFSDSTLHAYGRNQLGNPAYRRSDIRARDYSNLWNQVEWAASAKSLRTDVNQFGYEANLLLGHLWGRPAMSELHAHLDATAHYGFPLLKKSKGIAALQAAWDHYAQRYSWDNLSPNPVFMPLGYSPLPNDSLAFAHYYADRADGDRWGRNILTLRPYVDFLLRDFKFHVGLRGALDAFSPSPLYDTLSSLQAAQQAEAHLTANQPYLFPDIEVSKNFLNEAMSLAAGFTGDMEANAWDDLRLANAYLAPSQASRATRHYDVFARMRFDFSKKLGMTLHATYGWLRNGLCFRLHPEYALGNLYEAFYRDFAVLTTGGDFTFVNDEMLQASVGGNYYNYTAIEGNDLSFLSYRPRFDAHLGLAVNYRDKVTATLQGLLVGRMAGEYGRSGNAQAPADTLPMRCGLSLNVEYRHTRALSLFLSLDNVAAQRYFLWTHYPSRRLTAMLGLTYTIPTKKH